MPDYIDAPSPGLNLKVQATLSHEGRGKIRAADLRRDLQLAAQLIELWRLCRKSRCRRARACRGDARRCCAMLADWYEALQLKDKRVSFAEAMERLRVQSA